MAERSGSATKCSYAPVSATDFLVFQRHERMSGSRPLFHSHSRNSAKRSHPCKKQPCSSDVPIFHASAFCCTTDFALQRHLQQFFPPFMRLVACKQIEALFLYT